MYNRDMLKETVVNVKEQVELVRQMKRIAIVKLVLPFCLTGAAVLFLWFAGPDVYTKYVAVFSVYSFMPIGGAIAVIPAGLGLGVPPEGLIFFILFTDSTLSLFLVWNFDYAKRIPFLGELVLRTEENGEKAIRRYKWAKRFGFIGLVLFVMFPLQYTGSAVGSIAGRLLGMPSLMTWLAVVVGSFLRSLIAILIYYGALSFL